MVYIYAFKRLERSITKALKKMHSLRVLAIPELCSQVDECPYETTAETMIGAVLDFLSSKPICNVQQVYIVVRPWRLHVYKVLSLCIAERPYASTSV